MSSKAAIHAEKLGKCYQLYANPKDRLKQFLWYGKRQYYREFWALHDVSFDVMPGEVVGIIGRNGSGKSTLLQLVCGTLTPTVGEVAVKGRVAALLELGAGFNPEFTGSENVFMSAAVMGLSQEEIAARYEDIVEFSGIRDFIDQPVKTYSSGMYVRLAFSVAISVDPDILVIDEALSVGDGEFSRRSFDRIMALKDAGKTILFCSHSMYQVEALCNRVIWLDQGRIRSDNDPAYVTAEYNAYLAGREAASDKSHQAVAPLPTSTVTPSAKGMARITKIRVSVDGGEHEKNLLVRSQKSDLNITITFASDPALPSPSVAIVFLEENGRAVASSSTKNDNVSIPREADGSGGVSVTFQKVPLLKGKYTLQAFLLCERGVHLYESASPIAELTVIQEGVEQGIVTLPHRWMQLEG